MAKLAELTIKETLEKDLAAIINLEKKEEIIEPALKKIFLKSRRFGISLKNQHERPVTTEEITRIVEKLELPCFRGKWESKGSRAYQLERITCTNIKEKNPFICLFWQESLDGLLMGLGDEERLARHSSMVKGKNNKCLDIIYDSSEADYRWGEVPESIINLCRPLIRTMNNIKVGINLKGLAEETLYLELNDQNEKLMHFRRQYLLKTVKEYFRQYIPGLKISEISPRAVIEGEF